MLNLDKSGWETVRLGEVVRNVNENVRDLEGSGIERVIALEHLDPGEITISRYGDVSDGTTFTRRVRPGQTLFGKRRAYQRKAAYAEVDAICSGDILVFEALPERLFSRLLPFLVHSEPFYYHALGTSAGSLSPRTSWKALATYEFSLPPLDEQERIADLLWAVEGTLAAERGRRESLGDARAKYRSGFFGSLAPTSDARLPWDMTAMDGTVAIREVASVRAGATPSRSRHQEFFEDGTIPWVKTLDLNEGEVLSTDERITEFAVQKNSCQVRPKGTVLIGMYGGFNQIGRTGRLAIPAATNQAVAAVLNLDDRILSAYLLEALQAGRPWWRRVAASSRKDPNITKKDVEGFRFPLPALPEQEAFLRALVEFDKALGDVATSTLNLRSMMASLVADLWEH